MPSKSSIDTKIIRVLIVEDHELASFGLSMALAERANICVVGEAENGLLGVQKAVLEKPDVILMDIGMPVMNGITATQEIKSQLPDIKVIMLTSLSNEAEVLGSLTAGADAYCLKDIKIERLLQVIDMIMEGAIWLDPHIARLVVKSLDTKNTPSETLEHTKTPRKRYQTALSEREKEVLNLLVEGKSNKEIALILGVSTHTSKAHVGNIIEKLAVDDRTQAAVKALKEGLL